MIYKITKEDLQAIKKADRLTVRMGEGQTNLDFELMLTRKIVGEFKIAFESSSRNYSICDWVLHSNAVKVIAMTLKANDNISFEVESLNSPLTRKAGVVPYSLVMRVCRYHGKNETKHTTFEVLLDSIVEHGSYYSYATVRRTSAGYAPSDLVNKSTTAA